MCDVAKRKNNSINQAFKTGTKTNDYLIANLSWDTRKLRVVGKG